MGVGSGRVSGKHKFGRAPIVLWWKTGGGRTIGARPNFLGDNCAYAMRHTKVAVNGEGAVKDKEKDKGSA